MKDQLLDKIIKFDNLLGITALSIAFVSAFFSVYGIATLFAGAFFLTALMASVLEIGKLVSITFLYRYWNKINKSLKIYMSMATFILMIITSLGIFGYLSSAYQKSSSQFKADQSKIEIIESQKKYLNDKISQSQIRIKTLNDLRTGQENRLNDALTNAFLTRNPLQLKEIQDQTIDMVSNSDNNIKIEQDSIKKSTDEIQKIEQQINDIKFSDGGKKDIRTFQFVADQFGTTLDRVAKWFILTLIFVFDPLAVALVLAYNVAIKKEIDENVEKISHSPIDPNINEENPNTLLSENPEIISASLPVTPEQTPIVPPSLSPSSIDADFRRMFKQ